MAQRSYTRDEMEEILRRAAERTQQAEDGVRHDDLVAAAREVGIDPAAIDDALSEMGQEKNAEQASARWTREARRGFASHFSTYAIVMAFLVALNVLATPEVWWSLYVALGWGLGVAFSARRALLPPSEVQVEKMLAREEKRAVKRARREAQRQAAEAWRTRWREMGDQARAAAEARKRRGSVLAQTEKEIDRAIEEGVNALVSALGKRAASAARTLSGEVQPSAAPPRTEFEHYVAQKRGTAPARPASGPIVTPPPPRTRVAEPEREADDAEQDDERSRTRRRRSR
jgi:hypothetical protein